MKVEGNVDWYCFVINNRNSGVPTSEDDEDFFFHVRFAPEKHVNPADILPNYCALTRNVEPAWVKIISIDIKGTQFDAFLFKEKSIEGV